MTGEEFQFTSTFIVDDFDTDDELMLSSEL